LGIFKCIVLSNKKQRHFFWIFLLLLQTTN
jgi:hypothetical protein